MSDVDAIDADFTHENPKTFAVVIANEHYQEADGVRFANNDGITFKRYCTNLLGIPEQNVHLRTDATLNNVMAELGWLEKVSKAYEGDCRVIVCYAGHGMPSETSKSAYLLPVDGIPTDESTAIPLSTFYARLAAIPSFQTTVFLDACFSGTNRDDRMLSQARGIAIKPKAETPTGNIVVFSAASGDETAYPYEKQSHGLFTYFLLKMLQTSKGSATLGEISDYVKKDVERYSVVVNNKSQTPVMSASPTLQNWQQLKLR